MTEFRLADRVRVRALPQTGAYAGRAGTVIAVERDTDGAVALYVVRLDADPANLRAADEIPYLPGELGPE